jgi:ABC-type nitrate/sulfonate/bicarbonate transport system substrate-binding protein
MAMYDQFGARTSPAIRTSGRMQRLRVGFVPLCDCAPLVVAAEKGFFTGFGLNVELVREVGWATVRDKLVHGELDAVHALAGLPFAATLGVGTVPTPCLTALVLNLQGNAITLSNALWKEGVRDAETLGEWFRKERRRDPLTFGIVFPISSHRFLLEKWLRLADLQPERDVRFVVAPPPQMPDNLRAGHIAGFCAGEPWNSVVVQSGDGWCPATSADLSPNHPEKVLAVRSQFVEEQPEVHLRLVAAVLAACKYCANPANHDEVAALLSQRRYVNAPVELVRRSFGDHFNPGHGRPESPGPFTVYHHGDSNEPTTERGSWVLRNCLPGVVPGSGFSRIVQQVFRSDLHLQAKELPIHETTLQPS